MEEKKTRSEAYYLDDDHNIVDPDKASKAVINEFDENGVMIRETWGFVDRVPGKEEWEKLEGPKWLDKLFERKKTSISKDNPEQLSQQQGIEWLAGQLEGRVFHLSEKEGRRAISIGTEAEDSPDLLIHSDSYAYYFISGTRSDNPYEYNVFNSFNGETRPAQSGDVFIFGEEVFRLL